MGNDIEPDAKASLEEMELRNAAIAMRDDLIERAKFGCEDAGPVVACGNSVWMRFCAAIHAHIAANIQAEGGS